MSDQHPDADTDPDHDGGTDPMSGHETSTDAEGGTGTDGWTVLVPIRILENPSLPHGLVELLEPVQVVLLGYYEVPDQTAPGQARLQFEDRAEDALQEMVTEIETEGGTVETRLVFTDDREKTFDRVADETGADAILLSNPAASVESLLVPVRSDANVAGIAGFLGALVADRPIGVRLYHAAGDDEAVDPAERLLSRVADALVDAGIPDSSVTTRVDRTDDRLEGIAEAAENHDAVVMGETRPSIASFVFGEFSERVANRSLDPVLVVRGLDVGSPGEPTSEAGDGNEERPESGD